MTKPLKLDDLARAIGNARCSAERPSPANGLDRFILSAILTTIKEAGWTIVPVEATDEMLMAPHEQLFMNGHGAAIWQAMQSASPQIEGE